MMNAALAAAQGPRSRPPCVTVTLALALLGWPGSGAAQSDLFPTLAPTAPAGTGEVAECTVPRMTQGLRCGVFRVYENREAAAGRTLDIHFAIAKATDENARTNDPVFFFFGGPGAAATDATPGVAMGLSAIRRTRDFVLVDMRGIGGSGSLSCDVPYPSGFASRFGSIFATDQLEACRDSLAKHADLTQYTTPISVDDLEELRSWLGYGPVNIYGGSYGTRVAQVYLRRHPESVRTVVMIGVTPVSTPGYVRTSPYLQRALDQVIAQCAKQTECAQAYPQLERTVEEAFAQFKDGSVTVEYEGREVQFHRPDLGYALRGLLYGRSAEVPYRIRQAAMGDFTELVAYYVERTNWVTGTDVAAGNHLSVICAEDIRPATDAAVRQAAEGTFLQGHVIQSYRAACDVWPEAKLPDDFFEPVRSDVPTLLLSGGRDPVTPPEGAELVAQGLSNRLHVVVPAAGHGVRGQCILSMILRLIEDGRLENVDTSCVAEVPAPKFRLPSGQ
jgi:pimeloyl-ACP methyl ester carboxylesterase